MIQEFFNFKDPFFYILWSIPFILTYLVIWKFPKWFLLSGYTEEEKYKTDKSLVKLKEAVKIKKEEAKLEEENAKELKALAEKKQSEKIIEDTDPTIKWEKEYQALKRRNNFYQFQQIYDIIYNNGGSVYGNQLYIAAKPLIAYLDNTNIVNFDGSNIELTEKGKYFMKRFLEEK